MLNQEVGEVSCAGKENCAEKRRSDFAESLALEHDLVAGPADCNGEHYYAAVLNDIVVFAKFLQGLKLFLAR